MLLDRLAGVNEIVLMADPRVTDIPAEDCGEPLIDVSTRTFLEIDPRKADASGDWLLLRPGLLTRLDHAASLLPDGLRLLHIEGYRPPDLQARYFTAYQEQLAATRPDLDADTLRQLTSRYISPPEIAPHSAGAAIDLTLCTTERIELDMGTPVNASPEVSHNRCYTAAPNISRTARANRDILSRSLSAAGLINYPTEWWHWSYGDRYWALHTAHPTAIYGAQLRSDQDG